MAEAATRLPIKTDQKGEKATLPQGWHPFEALHREIDQLFNDFGRGFWRSPFRGSLLDMEPFWRREMKFVDVPAVDIAEKDNAYEITADLPGMDEKQIEVRFSNGNLTIKGEKKEDKEEKEKDYYLQERRYGSFERSFGVPEGVDTDKIEASFKKGVLTITLPKKPEARQAAKKIDVKAA
jgi:HSP20 family protein